ncbi:ribonuclease-III-like-domain-containing protein [Mycena belliarum]|uniref:Ribonuclease-III-like-domain-containing protein n=1 Tax=Mycena belliarum TaxID=1033014 RepID=A0AAD6TS18_9AGAR|nr:ribonuclease-III-like-domain-containing protein [Mycena belliae]
MSRSLSARCLHRTVFSLTPSPVQCAPRHPPGGRRYSYTALKARPQPEQDYPRRQENPPPYSRAVPHEPGIRLQRNRSWQQSQAPHERDPPPTEQEPRRIYEGEGVQSASLPERGRRVPEASREEQRGEGSSSDPATRAHRRPTGEHSTRHRGSGPSAEVQRRPSKPDEIFSDHLNGLFSPLKFPQELSARILTHASHPAASHGHNAQFSFIGRRVLESYLLILLSSSPNLKPKHDLQEIVSRVLNTYFLGEHVGSKWGLGRVMRWTPTIAAEMLRDEARGDRTKLLKDVGLYKVQGDAVAAVVGGIFQQFGASVAHRVFHTRVLPRLLLPHGGLPTSFHSDANAVCMRLGGADGRLVLNSDASARVEQPAPLVSPTANRPTLKH